MYAYKISGTKIVAVEINPAVVPEGWVTSEEHIDPFKFEYIEGQFISKVSAGNATQTVATTSDLVVKTEEDIIAEITPYRDLLLRQSDWTQLPDAPIADELKQSMKEWRQQLRDFPKNARSLGYKLPVSPMAKGV